MGITFVSSQGIICLSECASPLILELKLVHLLRHNMGDRYEGYDRVRNQRELENSGTREKRKFDKCLNVTSDSICLPY